MPKASIASEQLLSIAKLYDDHCNRFNDCEQTTDIQAWAWGYWRKWYEFLCCTLSVVERAREEPQPTSNRYTEANGYALRQKLAQAHEAAVAWLMREAERRGLDSGNLSKCKAVVRGAIMSPHLEKYKNWKFGPPWPELLGDELYSLPPELQRSVLDSTAAFDRLIANLEIEISDAEAIAIDDDGDAQRTATAVERFREAVKDITNTKGRVARYLAESRTGFVHFDEFEDAEDPLTKVKVFGAVCSDNNIAKYIKGISDEFKDTGVTWAASEAERSARRTVK